jgi:broad specificity phosphatase PhoE
MTTLLLVRHGETDWNRQGRWQGHADRPLTAEGRSQAAAAGAALALLRPAAVYASDLERARLTAEPLASLAGLELRVRPDLREIDVGSWSGLTAAEIRATGPRVEAGETPGWEGGETTEAHAARILSALHAIVDLHPGDERVCVFTHGGCIRAAVAAAVGVAPRASRERIAGSRYCAVTILSGRTRADSSPTLKLVAFNADPAGALPLPASS